MLVARRLMVVAFVGLGALHTVGCAAPAEESVAAESALVGMTRLDRVTPAEIATTFEAQIHADLARCISGNPNISAVDRQNLDAFYRPGSDHHWDVRELLDAMLSEPGVSSVPVATLPSAVIPFATKTLAQTVDADGFYVFPSGGTLLFYYAEMETRESKAIALAQKPGGKFLGEIRHAWAEVEATGGTLDSAWLNPVKVAGEPSLDDVRKAMRIPFAAGMTAWGHDAIDEFHQAHEGPQGVSEFEPLKDFLHSNAIEKRWLFQGGGDKWSTNVLVVLDEHNQLWGMQMGYSE